MSATDGLLKPETADYVHHIVSSRPSSALHARLIWTSRFSHNNGRHNLSTNNL